jgi:perosamine synthetase
MRADEPGWPALPLFEWQALTMRGRPIPGVLDAPRLLFTTSGRAALYHALCGLGVGSGDSVLVPTYHCPTMVSPVVALGARPVFYPLAEGGVVDISILDGLAVTEAKAILAAHYFGLPRPMQALRDWCDRHRIALIEDCAHALFGRSEGRTVGSWGDYAIASLPKFLPVPEGGCLVASADRALPKGLDPIGSFKQLIGWFDLLDLAARHGRPALLGPVMKRLRRRRPAPLPPGPELDDSNPVATAVAPALDLPLAQRRPVAVTTFLARYLAGARSVARRRLHHAQLTKYLEGCPELRPVVTEWPDDCAPYVFALWVDRPDPGYQILRQLGIPVFRWNWRWPGADQDPTEWGNRAAHHVLQVACHQSLTDADVETIADALRRVYGQ